MKIERYDIFLDLTNSNLSYTGKERITFSETENEIVLDSVGLDYESVTASGVRLQFKVENNKLKIENKSMSKNIEITFSGNVGKTLTGMYYADSKGGRMITTQFESTGARMVFPCKDEPAYKAVFGLSVKVADPNQVISNSSPKNIREEGTLKTYEFLDTPVMSTYLLYIGVADFESRKIVSKGRDFVLAGPTGTISSSDMALEVAAKTTEFFEDYFGVKYPLPKMHLVGVPEFAFGAMENWGAITFRNVVLFLDDSTSSYLKGRVTMTIGHEIAHQWFGDLVTMKWWDDIWLNESFAELMGYKVADFVYPDFHEWDDFLLDMYSRGLRGDSLKNTHPVHTNLKTPEEIMQVFDEISYGKGGAILRMIEGYVGTDNFRRGVSDYLKRFSYSNASGSDLWKSITKACGKDLDRMIDYWVNTPGYPIIEVTAEGDQLVLKQGRYTYEGIDYQQTWPIPVTVVRKSGVESFLFEGNEMRINSKDFVKLNWQQSGFYRVLYEEKMYRNIANNLSKFSRMDSWGVANDTYAFLQSGVISYGQYFDRIKLFAVSDESLVIRAFVQQLGSLSLIRVSDAGLKQFAISYLKEKLARIGDRKVGEEPTLGMVREDATTALARLDDDYARQMSLKLDELENQDPNVRRAILLSYARMKDDPVTIGNKMASLAIEEDRVKSVSALGWVQSKESMEKALEMTKDGRVRKQDTFYLFYALAMNPKLRDHFLDKYEEELEAFRKVWANTVYVAEFVEVTVPFLGLKNPSGMRSLLEKVNGGDISSGVAKGLEYLEVYGRIASLPRN